VQTLLLGTENLLQRVLAMLFLPVRGAKHLAELRVHCVCFAWRRWLSKDGEHIRGCGRGGKEGEVGVNVGGVRHLGDV
jgi:hypothetical protein